MGGVARVGGEFPLRVACAQGEFPLRAAYAYPVWASKMLLGCARKRRVARMPERRARRRNRSMTSWFRAHSNGVAQSHHE